MRKHRMEITKLSHQMVVSGLVGMVEDDGMTMHEAFEVLEDIKSQVFPALMEISRERRQAQ